MKPKQLCSSQELLCSLLALHTWNSWPSLPASQDTDHVVLIIKINSLKCFLLFLRHSKQLEAKITDADAN